MIEVRQLSFAWSSDLILDDISFSVSPGNPVAITGANGSGKSNLLRVIAGLSVPISGTVIQKTSKAGDNLAKGGTIVLYTDDLTSGKTLVPNVIGLTASAANKLLTDAGLNIHIVGASNDHLDGAIAVTQSITENTTVDKGTVVEVDFRNYSNITD